MFILRSAGTTPYSVLTCRSGTRANVPTHDDASLVWMPAHAAFRFMGFEPVTARCRWACAVSQATSWGLTESDMALRFATPHKLSKLSPLQL